MFKDHKTKGLNIQIILTINKLLSYGKQINNLIIKKSSQPFITIVNRKLMIRTNQLTFENFITMKVIFWKLWIERKPNSKL